MPRSVTTTRSGSFLLWRPASSYPLSPEFAGHFEKAALVLLNSVDDLEPRWFDLEGQPGGRPPQDALRMICIYGFPSWANVDWLGWARGLVDVGDEHVSPSEARICARNRIELGPPLIVAGELILAGTER